MPILNPVSRRSFLLLLVFTLFASPAFAQPGGDDEQPILRIKTFGPAGYVSALAFSPDGKTLYAGGWDKVIRVWELNDETGQFDILEDRAFRVPIGPGLYGGINAISVSDDGRWLAVGGRAPVRGLAGFQDKTAYVVPSTVLTDEQRLDLGSIYVFDTHNRTTHILRGHNSPVITLEFASGKGAPVLVSAADRATGKTFAGAVYVWDVEGRKTIAKLEKVPSRENGRAVWQDLPGLNDTNPGLAAWRTGPGEMDVRVAVAWGDNAAGNRSGFFRVWDVGTRQVATATTGSYPFLVDTIYSTATGQELLGGAYRELGVWTIPQAANGGLPGINMARNFRPIAGVGEGELPTRAALFAAQPGPKPDRAAVVIQSQSQNSAKLQLQLVDLARRQPLGNRILIEEGSVSELKQPSIAATPQGRYVAVSGSKDDAIRLYEIRRLLAGNAGNPQILAGTGTSWQDVSFVKKGDALGLSLKTTGGNPRQGLTFDITNREVVGDAAGWQVNQPNPAGWRADYDAANRRVNVFNNNQLQSQIPLGDRHAFTAAAVVPAGEHFQVPLVAVARHRLGEPLLSLYDATTGKELREFAGHLERIRDLAFSADGRLLVSVADDRTVRVWWLADIDETRGKLGRVSGLFVEERDNPNAVVVTQVDDDSAAKGKLQPGDTLLSIQTKDGQPATFKTRYEFYEILTGFAPGIEVRLTVRRGGQLQPVTLTADQGIDRRNPLFSLFLKPAQQTAATTWIGWHPIGPYDRSTEDAERYLGWHFNTGDPDSPTRFASADQYRKTNYDSGLLKRLIELGPPGVSRPAVGPPPKLNMNVSVVTAAGKTYEVAYDEQRIHENELIAQVTINDDFPRRLLESVQWKLDDGEPQPLTWNTVRGAYQAELPPLKLKRGMHTLTAIPTAAAEGDSYSSKEMKFLYFPPQPQVKIDENSLPAKTDQRTVTLKAEIENVDYAGAVNVELLQNAKVIASWTTKAGQPLKISHEIELAPGKNPILLKARNADALKDYEDFETELAARWIAFDPADPPVISITRVLRADDSTEIPIELLKAGGEAASAQRFVSGDYPRLVLQGTIDSPDPLSGVSVLHPGAKEGETPAGFIPNKVKKLAFSQSVTLEPGRQTITVRATTGKKQVEEQLVADYVPVLPAVMPVAVVLGPDSERMLREGGIDLYRGTDPATVKLRVRIQYPYDPRDAQIQPELNGKPVGEPLDVTAKTEEFEIPLALAGGENVVLFQVKNAWRKEETTVGGTAIHYRRPPVVAGVEPAPNAQGELPDRKDAAAFNFTATVNSDIDVPLKSVEVQLNGEAVAGDTVAVAQDANDKSVWNVAVSGMPLYEGTNRIQLVARNGDGDSQPFAFSINQLRQDAMPVIALESSTNAKVSTETFPLRFKVHSQGPLSGVTLIVDSRQTRTRSRISLAGDGAATGEPNVTRFSKTVKLSPGLNEMLVIAENAGGPARSRRMYVNVVLPPITISLDKVVPDGRPGQPMVTQTALPDGVHIVESAPTGHATIYGHVEWRIDAAARRELGDSQVVRVWVNGFLRMAHLTPVPGQPQRAEFQLSVVLNREMNRIEFEHADLPVRDDNRPVFLLCGNPERKQNLHLVVVGVRKQPQRNDVKAEFIKLHADEALKTSGTKKAFANIVEYRTLAGPDAVSERIRSELNAVVNRINARSREQQLNDVVMIYYHGKEVRAKTGEFRLADYRNWDDPAIDRSTISSTYLSDMLNNRIPGAHLVLLDVNHDGEKIALRWPQEPHLGVLRINTADQVHLLAQLKKSMPAPTGGQNVDLKLVEAELRKVNRANPGTEDLDSNIPAELETLVLGSP